MWVKMKTLSCGPNGVRRPGETHEVDDDLGRELVAGKYAEFAEEMIGIPKSGNGKPETMEAPAPTAEATVTVGGRAPSITQKVADKDGRRKRIP